jgi:transcriptional regulator with XRE-family HTH domain
MQPKIHISCVFKHIYPCVRIKGVQDLERGLVDSPRFNTLLKLAKAFDVPVEDISGVPAVAQGAPSERRYDLLVTIIGNLPSLNDTDLSDIAGDINRRLSRSTPGDR